MSSVIRSHGTNPEVKTMALRMFQQWALAFESRRDLAFLVDVYHELKNSGVKFPPPPTGSSTHMIDTITAPTWVDSDVCMRCRTAFTFTNRKHHCRNCGLVFDQACSSRLMPLPKFGIKEEVRVCEGCWIKAGKNKPAPAVPGRTRRTREDYDADLQRAIELSLQAQSGHVVGAPSEPPLAYKNGTVNDDDEQLRLAIEASLRDMERARPSAPSEELEFKPLPTFDLAPRETETILTFSNTLDQMAAYGERDLRRFPQAHMLYEQAYGIGPKLYRNVEEKSTKQAMLAEMQAKLTQAVAMYGSILDGQQAFSQRKAQEAQQQAAQRHQLAQQQQQQQYGYPYGFQQYPGYSVPQQPYANGYAPQQYQQPPQAAPPQAQPQAAPSAPSMYPAMPVYGAYQQPYQAAPHAAQQQQYAPQWSSPPSTSRQASYAAPGPAPVSPSAQSAPAPVLPNTYVAEPQNYEHAQQVAQQQQQQQVPSAPPQPQSVPSAPPPVDLASHPSMSPRSTTSALPAPSAPARSASYASPVVASAPLAVSPVLETAALPSAPPQPQAQPQPVRADSTPNPWANEFQQPQQQQQYTAPQQQPFPGYTASMFPAAPAGFQEPQQPVSAAPPAPREEALLIEL